MGASQEKRKRSEAKIDGLDIKARKFAEEEKKRKKDRNRYILIGAASVLLIAVVLVFGSNLLYRHFSAVKAGNKSYSAVDYNYYHRTISNNYYYSYYNMYGDYAQYFMPDAATLQENTLTTMQEVAMLGDEAARAGYTLSQDGLDSIEEAIASYETMRVSYNYQSLGSFLASVFGKGMNEKIFRRDMTEYLTATSYGQEKLDSYSYSEEELKAYYGEHSDEYDNFTYRYLFFDGSATEADAENGIEAVDADTAMGNAKALADEFIGKASTEASFIALALEYAEESDRSLYADESATLTTLQGSSLRSNYPEVSEWICDPARTAGDKTVVEASNGYYALYFISREDNDYLTVNVRHILITPDSVSSDDYDTDEEYQAAQEAADKAARETADEIYDQWKAGDRSEDSFSALAEQYSSDSSSANGGLIEKVRKGQMVEPFEEWCFADSRAAGDTGVVESAYGYHIMYYVGTDMNCNDYFADTAMREEDYSAWKDGNLENYPLSTTWLLKWGSDYDPNAGNDE